MKKIIRLKKGEYPPEELREWLGENGFLEISYSGDDRYYEKLTKDIQLIIEVIEE
jgi:hypothetical protein